jgi:glycosyltransferase involved in cell wall biosynthesis
MSMRVVHVISNLNIGGAEMSLCSLVEVTAGKSIDHTVISFLPHGALCLRLERAGAAVVELAGHRGIAGALLLRSLARAIAGARPSLVQAWMYHANVATSIAKSLRAFDCPLIWSIRQSADNLALDGTLTRALIGLGAWLSVGPEAIVYNSLHGAASHEAIGYSPKQRWVIPNGVDCDRFKPRPLARGALRAELGLERDAILIGRVARYAPMKDFDTLLRAHRQVLDRLPAARLVMIGEGVNTANAELVSLCRKHGCLERVHLLRPRVDIEAVYPALDVLVSASSANEGFPNVVAEGLASGTLVVATEIGEEQLIKEGAHAVVSPKDAEALSAAILQTLALSQMARRERGEQGRIFVQKNYSVAAFSERHCALYQHLLLKATGERQQAKRQRA